MISYRNKQKDFDWINTFIKTHFDDADTPLIKCMQLVRNNIRTIRDLEKRIKDLEKTIKESTQ